MKRVPALTEADKEALTRLHAQARPPPQDRRRARGGPARSAPAPDAGPEGRGAGAPQKKGWPAGWDAVKRCLKRLGFTFRRARRVMAKPPCPKQQGRVRRALARLRRLEDAGRCQVLYGDESGFCLSPPVPSLWQKKGQTVCLPAQSHARRLNVLGFLSRAGRLRHFETPQKITAAFVIEGVEALLPALPGPTVLVLDDATVHRSELVAAKRKEWKRRGLRLLFLPPYCPPLNLIETLWRQVKCRWLGPEAYRDFETLCQSVADILAQAEAKYRLSFA